MRTPRFSTIALISASLLLAACGKPEVKTGQLTQRFTMVDADNVHFGVVELNPISGGAIYDVQGRVVGRIVAPEPTTVAAAQ